MKGASIVLPIMVFALSVFFLSLSLASANDLTSSEIHHTVANLINSKRTVHIQGIGIKADQRGQLNLEIIANIGHRWGEEELAKGYAKEVLKTLFDSDLPVYHVVLKVYGNTEILLTVALGKNQAKNLNWDKEESLNLFFGRMKSKMNYGGNPADYCWVIENNLTKQ